MDSKKLLPFVLAIVLGLGAVVVGKKFFRPAGAATPNSKFVQVVIAKTDLQPGDQVEEKDLGLITLPAESTPQGTMRKVADVAGRVVAMPIAKGQLLLTSSLAAPDAVAGLRSLVPAGMRAVTIDVNESSGMTGLLTPGCYVDVVATLIDDQARQTISRTIVENVKVTAIGTATAAKPGTEDASNGKPKIVTLVVTPAQAEALDLAASRGRPRLILRGNNDAGSVHTRGATVSGLVGTAPSPLAASIDRGGSAVAGFFGNLAARMPRTPATQPALPPAEPEQAKPSFITVKLIRGGTESVTQIEVPAANVAAGHNTTGRESH